MARTMGRKLTAHEMEVRHILSEWKANTHSFIIEELAEYNERVRQMESLCAQWEGDLEMELTESRHQFQKWFAQWEDDTWS